MKNICRSSDLLLLISSGGCFHSAHPTGWAEFISGNGVCVCVHIFTSKEIMTPARACLGMLL